MMHDRTGYTPYAGRPIKGWPVTILRRGEIIVENGSLKAAPGSGQFLPRPGGEAARPAMQDSADMILARRLGARFV
jgi:dihydropyrimidinase